MKRHKKQFAMCVRNEEADDLEIRKVYRVLPDVRAAKDGLIRVIDESGEDYLYPANYFVPVELPQEAERVLSSASRQST
ncbi:MAG: hypothetical protein AABZ71_05045 [Candidatus Binatota bacterium]